MVRTIRPQASFVEVKSSLSPWSVGGKVEETIAVGVGEELVAGAIDWGGEGKRLTPARAVAEGDEEILPLRRVEPRADEAKALS